MDDFGNAVCETIDGDFVLGGMSATSGAGSWDVYLIRTDQYGDSFWTRVYGGLWDDIGFTLCPTYDGEFIIAGYTLIYGNGNADMYFIKVNVTGDTSWTKTVGRMYEDIGQSYKPGTAHMCAVD